MSKKRWAVLVLVANTGQVLPDQTTYTRTRWGALRYAARIGNGAFYRFVVARNVTVVTPVRICCGQRHSGPVCLDGQVMCCLCFQRVPAAGLTEDVCSSCTKGEVER